MLLDKCVICLYYIGETIERRRLEFVNNVLDIPYLTCLFPLWF